MDSNNDTPLGFWGIESEEVISRQYPIHKACRDGDVDTLSRLVSVATPDLLTMEDQFYGWTPIHWAAYFGKINCLDVLLRTGISVNVRTTRFKQTPAHISAFGGHPSSLLELLKAGANFQAQDYLGETPMHKAARVGNVGCIRILMQNGAKANVCNNNGHTAADLARMQSFTECSQVLDIACSDLEEQARTNGFVNGTSGVHLLNGHATNGWLANGNGHHVQNGVNGCGMEKRSYDDESIPCFKRARVFDVQCERHHRFTATDDSPFVDSTSHLNGNGFLPNCDVPMDDDEVHSEMCPTTPPEPGTFYSDAIYPRAPSPGMDLLQHSDDSDVQLWCHMQGYGDTAEAVPCEEPVKSAVNKRATLCDDAFRHRLKGIQARGWS